MTQSSTLSVGMEVHKDALAVAYVAQELPADALQARPPAGSQAFSDWSRRHISRRRQNVYCSLMVSKPRDQRRSML